MKSIATILLCLFLVSCGEENANQDDQANVQVKPTKEEAELLKKKLKAKPSKEKAEEF